MCPQEVTLENAYVPNQGLYELSCACAKYYRFLKRDKRRTLFENEKMFSLTYNKIGSVPLCPKCGACFVECDHVSKELIVFCHPCHRLYVVDRIYRTEAGLRYYFALLKIAVVISPFAQHLHCNLVPKYDLTAEQREEIYNMLNATKGQLSNHALKLKDLCQRLKLDVLIFLSHSFLT